MSGPDAATLTITQLVALAGLYPVRDGGGPAAFTIGMLQSNAGGANAFGAPGADGQMMPVMSNPALYSVLGPSYGGDGTTSFALPNLAQRVPVGGVEVGMQGAGTLTLRYVIAVEAGGGVPFAGSVAMFGGNYAPSGWMACDGTLLPIASYPMLFSVIGSAFGGDGATSFALPNLNGAAAVGIGAGLGLAPVALGQQVPGSVPGIGLNYVISTEGNYPPPDGGGAFPGDESFIGQILASAGGAVPPGWMQCNGALLPIANYQALYSLLGPKYGGDGRTNFALPDLRGRMMIGR